MGSSESDPLFGDAASKAESSDKEDESEFAVPLDEMKPDIRQGKEIKRIEDRPGEEGDVYAGRWPIKLFAGAEDEPRQPIWVGYTEPDPLHGPREVPIEFNSQFRHVALFGSTGMGKSTVLKNMMVQWALGGYGFCYIDPKGDDSKELMEILPEDRLDDVIWIEPSPDEYDKVVGINFLDPSTSYGDDDFEQEVQQIIDDIIPILRDESFWGPRMDEVVRGFLRAMLYLGSMEQNEDYTLVDLYKLLTNQEVRKDFAEKVENQLGNEGILQNAIEKFAEIDDSDLASARRRLQEWVIDKNIQQVVAHTESKVNITQAVQDGKIIIVRTASINDQRVKRGVATVVIRRIWTAIQMRESMEKSERDPYFLCVDEFDDVVSSESDIGRILSKGRSLRLGTVLANQQPHQLSREVQDDVLGNCNTLLAMNPKHPDDAKVISKVFDVDVSNIINLGRFQLATQIEVDGEPSSVFRTETFPEYPPRRSREEATALISEIVEDYGVEPIKESTEDVDGSKFDPDEGVAPIEQTFEVSDDGDTMEVKEVLRAVYTAQINKGGPDEFVQVEDVEDAIEEKVGAAAYNKVSNVLTERVDDYIEKRMSDDVELRLSQSGQRKAFTQDTGDSASAGKEIHRFLLQLSHETFERLGYDFTAPKQVGGKQPDGIALPPINPAKEADSAREIAKLIEKFKNHDEYGQLFKVFGPDELNIEAEKATETKPKQVLKNLAKAVEDGRDCVFVVRDGKHEGSGLAGHANRILNPLSNPPYVNKMIEREDGKADPRFYNKNSRISIPSRSQTYALYGVNEDSGSTQAVWKRDAETGEIILENKEGDELAKFDDIEDFKNPQPEDFPYTFTYDNSQHAAVVTDRDGNQVDKFESTANKGPSEVMTDNGYKKIPEPFIPEIEFPGDGTPDEDQWHIVVIPHSERDYGPRYYDKETGELKPLFEDDEPLSVDKIPEPDKDAQIDVNTDKTQKTKKEQTEKKSRGGTDWKEEVEEEPKVADSGETKSNTDVIEESDEVWTKPKPGDDDYNPAKDGSRHEVHHDEDRTGASWQGGDARDAEAEGEDFENYTPPGERDETQEKESQEPQTEEPEENENEVPTTEDIETETIDRSEDDNEEEEDSGPPSVADLLDDSQKGE